MLVSVLAWGDTICAKVKLEIKCTGFNLFYVSGTLDSSFYTLFDKLRGDSTTFINISKWAVGNSSTKHVNNSFYTLCFWTLSLYQSSHCDKYGLDSDYRTDVVFKSSHDLFVQNTRKMAVIIQSTSSRVR